MRTMVRKLWHIYGWLTFSMVVSAIVSTALRLTPFDGVCQVADQLGTCLFVLWLVPTALGVGLGVYYFRIKQRVL